MLTIRELSSPMNQQGPEGTIIKHRTSHNRMKNF
jgi:hypothetical protein